MSNILITVIHPTRRTKPTPAFPHAWREASRVAFERADHSERIQYLLAVHKSRWNDLFDEKQAELGEPGRWENFQIVRNEKRDCGVDQVNVCMDQVSGEIVVILHDDMFPPQGWDTMLLDLFRAQYGTIQNLDREAVIHVSSGMLKADGWELPARNDELFNPQILTMARARSLGYFGFPAYESMFSDDEFSEHARRDGVVIDARHIVFEHRHPIFGGQVDETYLQENRGDAYRLGLELLTRRRAAGFPGIGAEMVQMPARQKLVVCLPGESFSSRWVAAWDGLRCALSAVFDIQPIFGHSSNVYAVRNCLAKQALASGADYVLWLDDDNTIEPAQFIVLYEDLKTHAQLGMIAAWCWIAHDGFGAQKPIVSCGYFDQDGNNVPIEYARLMKGSGDIFGDLGWSGFPCVLMPRATLEKLGPNPFTAMLSEKHAYGMTGEDSAFCKRVKDAGLLVGVDRRIRIPHLKLSEAIPADNPEIRKTSLVKRAGEKVLAMMGA